MISYERLCIAVAENNWTLFIDILKPKYFPRDEKGILIDKKILAKVAETLTAPRADIPSNVTIILLKCLVNSCLEGYTYEKLSKDHSDDESLGNFCNKFYGSLSTRDYSKNGEECFSYDGTVEWAVHYILNYISNPKDSEDCIEILRLSVQFLCNLSTFACKSDNLPHALNGEGFKSAIITLAGSAEIRLSRAACAFVHNALKNLSESYYDKRHLDLMAENLIEADRLGIQSAGEALEILLKRQSWLQTIYQQISIESKLCLLEIILRDVRETIYSERNSETRTNFPSDFVQFLSERFRERSDLILKTVDSYLDGMEPREITLLLDVIGLISSEDSVECRILKNDKSLMINCIFLLKSVHMAGKTSENHFTPLQKLSDIAPCNREMGNIQDHPAFGFKAGLIRAIGNLAHRHKGNQELLRETDAIPLLLDCCNIDARNPLILQWTIFALRNVCLGSPENQEIIRNCNRVGIVDNDIIREMGIKLDEGEDGKAIGIFPLPK